ncbi:fatty-acid--CoA ligase [Mycobacterium tuberculosis]|nr:fatty-acid--CoA ligase [Mycobacterium tuberculosis]
MVRRGYITAFTVPASDGDDRNQRLVIIAERAAGRT